MDLFGEKSNETTSPVNHKNIAVSCSNSLVTVEPNRTIVLGPGSV